MKRPEKKTKEKKIKRINQRIRRKMRNCFSSKRKLNKTEKSRNVLQSIFPIVPVIMSTPFFNSLIWSFVSWPPETIKVKKKKRKTKGTEQRQKDKKKRYEAERKKENEVFFVFLCPVSSQ